MNKVMSEIVDVGNRKQLFIDERFIQSARDVSLVMNSPTKLGAVVLPDKLWESRCLDYCVTVAEDEGIYKMWYLCTSCEGKPTPPNGDGQLSLCYAYSTDGIHWEKPELGLFEFAGRKDNNIVVPNALETTVFIDPHGSSDTRYKAITVMHWPDPESAGIYVHTSADGLHWNISKKRVLPFIPDTSNQVMWDRRLGKYVAHIRAWNPERKVGRIEMDDVLEPWPYTPSQHPYRPWGVDNIPSISTEVPMAFEYDEDDPMSSDHYNSAAVEYPWAEDAYFMFPSLYLHFPSPPIGMRQNDGVLDIQMAISRDGVKYDRISRRPYIGRSKKDNIDSSCLYMSLGMLKRDKEILQYYAGYNETHGDVSAGFQAGAICAVSQRLDGFVSADFAHCGGELITPKITFNGSRLVLNLDAHIFGRLNVGILDESGMELPKFSAKNCDAMSGDFVEQVVTWKGNSDISELADREVQLYFSAYSTKLYAFKFID